MSKKTNPIKKPAKPSKRNKKRDFSGSKKSRILKILGKSLLYALGIGVVVSVVTLIILAITNVNSGTGDLGNSTNIGIFVGFGIVSFVIVFFYILIYELIIEYRFATNKIPNKKTILIHDNILSEEDDVSVHDEKHKSSKQKSKATKKSTKNEDLENKEKEMKPKFTEIKTVTQIQEIKKNKKRKKR